MIWDGKNFTVPSFDPWTLNFFPSDALIGSAEGLLIVQTLKSLKSVTPLTSAQETDYLAMASSIDLVTEKQKNAKNGKNRGSGTRNETQLPYDLLGNLARNRSSGKTYVIK